MNVANPVIPFVSDLVANPPANTKIAVMLAMLGRRLSKETRDPHVEAATNWNCLRPRRLQRCSGGNFLTLSGNEAGPC